MRVQVFKHDGRWRVRLFVSRSARFADTDFGSWDDAMRFARELVS